MACPTCGQALVVPAAAPTPVQATGTIAVGCRCGKRFAAPPHLAGRQVQCPACQQALMVPTGAMRPATTAAPVAATGPIAVSCRCGKSFAAPPNLAGKRVACPSCRNPIQVPHPGAPSAPSAANGDGFWDEIESPVKTPQAIYAAENEKKETLSPPQATSYAINRLARGAAPGSVYDELREKGVGHDESERIVEDLQDGKKRRIKGGAPSHNSKVGMAFWGLATPGWLSILGAIIVLVLMFVREYDRVELILLIVFDVVLVCMGIGHIMTAVLLQNRFKPARYIGFFFAILSVCSCSLPNMICGVCALISLSSGDMTEYLNEE
ncbi:MAG TPA: hypothetical protein QF564_22555 [Pirellulaceae bacterium]|nr:hypothetical protein [Pirellulaceae bacterium]